MRELESRLDELQSRPGIKSLEEGNKENTETIQSESNSASPALVNDDTWMYRARSYIQREAGSLRKSHGRII